MGNTLDMSKIRDDHQQLSERLMQASASGMAASQNYTDEVMLGCYAAMLTELATVWREKANHLSELPNPKPRGWKTTMDSYRDCATRVAAVAVAMRTHGLPGDDSGPKEKLAHTTAGASTPVNGAQAEALPAAGVQQDQAQTTGESSRPGSPCDADPKASTGSSGEPAQSAAETMEGTAAHLTGNAELQRDLQAVHNGALTVNDFRKKWPEEVPTDQMVEFLKNRKGDADPKDAPVASATTENTSSSAPGNSNGKESPHPSDDPAGDFLRDLGRVPNGLVNKVHEESLAEAASAIIEQVRAKDGAPTLWSSDAAVKAGFSPGIGPVTVIHAKPSGEVFMNSGGILDTSNLGEAHLTLQWNENLSTPGIRVLPEGHDVQIIPGSFTIGAADAPPAWSAQPQVPVFELDSPMALEPPAHVSVSQANEAAECGLKRKLNKRHGAPSAPGWALVGGKAFHACVQDIEEHGFTEPYSSMAIAALWTMHFKLAIAQTEQENPLFPKATWHASKGGKENEAWWNADGPEMVHHYLEWRAKWIADGWVLLKTADGRPVVEHEFLTFIGGVMVKGFIDSAWIHKGRNMITIIDWKSGSSKPADYFQQATYRHALEPLLSRHDAYTSDALWLGAFWDARSGELGPLVDLDVRHPLAEVEMRLSLPRRLDAAALYMPNVNTGYGGCGSCSVKRSCPVGSRIGKGEVKL